MISKVHDSCGNNITLESGTRSTEEACPECYLAF